MAEEGLSHVLGEEREYQAADEAREARPGQVPSQEVRRDPGEGERCEEHRVV